MKDDIIVRLRREWMATQAQTSMGLWVMVHKEQWFDCTALTRQAADLIENLRAELKDAKDRNVRLLSQLQEYEAREQ